MHCVPRPTTPFVALLLITAAGLGAGCKSKTADAPAAPVQSAASDTALTQAAAFPPPTVDELVAPIALYPDQLLGQILTISTTPQEVLDVGNWLLQNQNLTGDALAAAAKAAGFTPSAQYLVLFPQVVDNMCQELDWTTQLGQAFQADQASVMAAVQRKRQEAQSVGNLVSSPQMSVATKQADNGDSYIEVAPADPKVVYVPSYNPVTVYTTAPPATTTTTTTSGVSSGAAAGIGLLSFGLGMAIGSAVNNNNDYYPYPSWGYSSMYYGGRPYYPPPYRAPVYSGYRPVYGYNPPPNYRWNEYNRTTNITVNGNGGGSYYNRFDNKSNPNRTGNNKNNFANNNNRPGTNDLRSGNNNRPGNNDNRPGNNTNRLGADNNKAPLADRNRPGQGAAAGGKPEGAYAGARPKADGQRPGAGMASANPSAPGAKGPGNVSRPGGAAAGPGTRDVNRPGTAGVNRPSTGAKPANRPGAGAAPTNRVGDGDRGYGAAGGARPSTGNAAASRPTPSTRPSPKPEARPSTKPAARPAPQPAARPTPQPQSRPAPQKQGGAFGGGGGGGGGNSARAASSRGQASMGSKGGGASARGAGKGR